MRKKKTFFTVCIILGIMSAINAYIIGSQGYPTVCAVFCTTAFIFLRVASLLPKQRGL